MTKDEAEALERAILPWVEAFIQSLKPKMAKKWQQGIDTEFTLVNQLNSFLLWEDIEADEPAREVAVKFMQKVIFKPPFAKAAALQEEFAALFADWLDAQSD